ncbi:MAG: class I SAM-dependent methyltransferase [Patescibacteria group bacterium]
MKLKIDPILKKQIIEREKNLPPFLNEPQITEIGIFDYSYYKILLSLFKFFILFRLKIIGTSYKDYDENLIDNDEVEKIYGREAKSYEQKHHITTNYRDTWWRRQVGIDIVSHAIHSKEPLKILDVATGVGLSVEEILKMMKLFNKKGVISAIDYSQEMLNVAKSVTVPRLVKLNLINNENAVKFLRADARNLQKSELQTFTDNYFDCATIMFGIGGIDNPIQCLSEVLTVLKKGGTISMIDIHRPILSLEEKWPFFVFKRSANAFNILAWEQITKPIVLGKLWGWRDTTVLFYILPFIVIKDEKTNRLYSFKTKNFILDNEKWWFNLQVMFTGKIVAEKIEIDEKEYEYRRNVLLKLEI